MKIDLPLPHKKGYPVYIDQDEQFLAALAKHTGENNTVFITNTTLEQLYRKKIAQWKEKLGKRFYLYAVPDGEAYKTQEAIQDILTYLLEHRLDRKTVIVAFGGGVVGDMAGFAASIFLRGVPYVQLPTTLLSMVDSSVGGKTGVNHPMGKNLIGSFYQPQFVWISTTYLKTLPPKEYQAGCGEILKYGFIGGSDSFAFMENSFLALLGGDPHILREAIRRSVEIKARIVSEDEREHGTRALLNLGHTFGHAFEHELGFGNILHGEAVFWGILCAIELAIQQGLVSEEDSQRLRKCAAEIPRPSLPYTPKATDLYEAMKSDKKVSKGEIRFVLPRTLGTSEIISSIPREAVLKTITKVLQNDSPY
ncbi:3-dehydroquinate synthase [Chitinivibrio alkaliphilus]|uniref:3-dehydroquinate synthase n=1 Tax=Chitinivibrio alkaliphilus ACht1 TaxID=1313304 RepID=U7D7J8_9BACT|nr:3-dehydroquinate synthase [Chitinivibrio alkaliphilus]ERP31556.1 3-dehydroquinate synthase [Chitinivibrio alkaliphilus ACht1]